MTKNILIIIIVIVGMVLCIFPQIVAAGQDTVIMSSSTIFTENKAGTDFTDNTITDSLVLTNTGNESATISVRFISNYSEVFGMVNGTFVIGASNFTLGSTVWNPLNDGGTATVLTDTVSAGSDMHYKARIRIPPGQPALDYVGTIEITFS